jgi:hypothetical protein
MSDIPRRVLYLVVGDATPLEIAPSSAEITTEVFRLTPATAPAALEKIFAADSVAVWGEIRPGEENA